MTFIVLNRYKKAAPTDSGYQISSLQVCESASCESSIIFEEKNLAIYVLLTIINIYTELAPKLSATASVAQW